MIRLTMLDLFPVSQCGQRAVLRTEQNEQRRNKRKHKERNAGDLCPFFKLGFHGSALVLAKEGFSGAGDCAGQTLLLALLHQNQNGDTDGKQNNNNG